MRVVIILAMLVLMVIPARAEGTFTNYFQYKAWIDANASAAKRKYVKKRYYKKRHYYKSRSYKKRSYRVARSKGGSASLSGIVAQLRSKCGAKVISGLRPGARTPFGNMSCHATGQAVDMTGNYACMYGVLRNWPGGYTTDARRCRHIHISSCKMEWGMRFNHKVC